MADGYIPELGQAVYGNSFSVYGCPAFVEAGLQMLVDEIERVEMNVRQQTFDAPTKNCGGKYETDVFSMYSYYWGDCTCGAEWSDDEDRLCKPDCLRARANFKCGDFEVRWYKYMGRGMSMNKNVDAKEFFTIIDKCLECVHKRECENGGPF